MWGFNWSAFRRRWPGRRPAAGATAKPSSGGMIKGPVRVSAFDEVLARLAARPDGGAGRLRVVSLADFRDTVGDKWPRLADKVAIIADTLIRRHMTGGNSFQRRDDDTWLLAFPNGDPDNARLVAARIAQDLSRHLLGDSCVAGERPLALVAHVGARAILNEDGEVDDQALRAAVDEGRSLIDHPAGPAEPMAWRPVARPEGMAARAPEWKAMENVKRPDGVEENWGGTVPVPADARLRLLWRPTWVAEGEAISAYCARILRMDHQDADPLEGPLAYPRDDVVSALRLDHFVASTALHNLRTAHAAGRAAAIIVPLSWASLSPEHRPYLVGLFADLSEEVRRNWVRVELFRIPDDTGSAEIQAAAAFLRALCGDVLVRLRLGSPLIDSVGGLGSAYVGLDLSELRNSERMNDESLLSALEALHHDAFHAGLGCYLWSARRRRIVGDAVRNGFGMVNGPGLMKDVGRPTMVVPAPRQRFEQAV